tara:strand:+ start:4049 stop:4306 length:258 start_codon:yes stop_codon:yes gene_type:complete
MFTGGMFIYRSVETLQEKKDITLYWENVRKQMEKMRDEFDEIQENKYNNKVLRKARKYNYKILLEDINNRPEFLEPINKKNINKK